jgi:hypothetical protein
MRKAQGVEDLASRLSEAAATPLTAANAPAEENRVPKERKVRSVSVFLRIPSPLHARLENEAVARTKATGRGVTVQQVILDKLAG